MFSYLIRRLLLLVPTLVGVTAVVFFVIAMAPGGLGAVLLMKSGEMRPEERKLREAYLKARYDLDKPLPYQYVKWLNKVSPVGTKRTGRPADLAEVTRRFDAARAGGLPPAQAAQQVSLEMPDVDRVDLGPDGRPARASVRPGEGFPRSWPVGFKAPDLGESFTRNRPVSDLILEALPVTLLLELISLPVIYLIAILSGIRAARARGRLVDVGLGTVLIAFFALPEIWVGVLLIGYLSNVEYVRWFPSNGLHHVLADGFAFLPAWTAAGGFQRGWLLDTLWHLALPVVCLSYGSFAFLSRLTRGSLLETLGQDFVRTARAKGLSDRVVLYRHAFRNSLIPLITVAANILPGLLAGSIVVETIYGLPGMGKLGIDAVNARDRELFLSITLIASFLQLVGYLLADVLYAVADPRVSYVD